jgi:oligopeptide transport system ATP-binding protein
VSTPPNGDATQPNGASTPPNGAANRPNGVSTPPNGASTTEPLLRVTGLTKHFPVTRGVLGRTVGQVRAVDNVSFSIAPGETLGLVGESGSGKTTAGRSILRLIEPTSGEILFDGHDVRRAEGAELRTLRRSMQIVFQDPYSSLNPRLRVFDLIGEALEVHGLARGPELEKRVAGLLRRVGLSPSWLNRYPHEFSGGQRQRIGVARAIALEPKLIVCDEPVSALDVSIQAQVVNLLAELRRELGLAYLFIAHDLSVVRHLSQRVAVMYLGEIVELAPTQRLFTAAAHPYTRALLAAVPIPDPRQRRRRLTLVGDIPSPLDPPSGCRFHTRCPAVMERCKSEPPDRFLPEPGHEVRCFHAEGITGDGWYAAVAANERATPPPPRVSLAAPPSAPPDSPNDPVTTAPAAAAPGRAEKPADRARPRPSARRGTLNPKLKYIAPVALLLSFLGARSALRQAEAERQLAAVASEVSANAALTGALPEHLGDLGWRLPPLFGNRGAVDPWGHGYRYRVLPGGRSFELTTLGPDGVESADDTRIQKRLVMPAPETQAHRR